jgi:hypothetical protein
VTYPFYVDSTRSHPVDEKTKADLQRLIADWPSLESLARRLGVRSALLTAAAAGARLTPRARQLVAAGLARYRDGRTVSPRTIRLEAIAGGRAAEPSPDDVSAEHIKPAGLTNEPPSRGALEPVRSVLSRVVRELRKDDATQSLEVAPNT